MEGYKRRTKLVLVGGRINTAFYQRILKRRGACGTAVTFRAVALIFRVKCTVQTN